VDHEPRPRARRYSFADWRADGYRGPPPWRRGLRPAYLALSIALVAMLLAMFAIAGSRLP
jgi:hypothetical protein